MPRIEIDLYSDTQTKPTPAMRRAMAAAEVGDEQQGSDPTVTRLCERIADLLGKEAAVFLPSGSMCNNVAILVHCRPGDEIIVEEKAHIVTTECGAPAALAGAMVRTVAGDGGIFSVGAVEAAIRAPRRQAPRSRLICVEQTTNFGMGRVWAPTALKAIAATARRHRLAVHMDGARLMNAVVASGVPAREFAKPCDSVWVDLTKGLGCPIGAVLAGSRALIEEGWVWKQRLGGAMRQAGIVAAAGLYALDHHVERLAEDHDNARAFAAAIADTPGIDLARPDVETNIVIFDITGTGLTAKEFTDRLAARGVRVSIAGPYALRVVTHLDLKRAQVLKGAAAVRAVAADATRGRATSSVPAGNRSRTRYLTAPTVKPATKRSTKKL